MLHHAAPSLPRESQAAVLNEPQSARQGLHVLPCCLTPLWLLALQAQRCWLPRNEEKCSPARSVHVRPGATVDRNQLESDSLSLEATSLWRGSEATQRSAVVHRGCEDADTSMGPRAPLPGSSPLMKATVNLHRSPHSMLARCHRSIAEMRLRGEKEAPGSFSDVSLRP